jgi:hypothetical protein
MSSNSVLVSIRYFLGIPSAKLTPEEVLNIRRPYATRSYTPGKLAGMSGVTSEAIRLLLKGKT